MSSKEREAHAVAPLQSSAMAHFKFDDYSAGPSADLLDPPSPLDPPDGYMHASDIPAICPPYSGGVAGSKYILPSVPQLFTGSQYA
jgi:hypothetical protein